MNHLKHIRGISVRASSNAALPLHYGQQADVYFENCQLKSQLLRSNSLSAAKKNHGVAVRHSGQFRQDSLRLVSKESRTICKQRSKTKSSVTSLKKKSSMHKKLPSENAAKRVCHYSTCQNAKFSSNGINKQFTPVRDAIINGARSINRRSSFIASVEKHPRSYAEMIADYSESLYKGTTAAARNDSFNNAIRKSPFSTFSAPSPVKTIVNVAEFSEFSTERLNNDFSLPVKSFDLCNRYNNVNAVECYAFKRHGMRNAEAMNKNTSQSCVTTNDLKSDDQSYAKLVTDCSKSMRNISTTSILNDGLESKENVLARNSFESVTTPRKDRDKQNKLREMTPTDSTMPYERNIKEQVIDLKEDDWLKEMENVMSDLKSATERKVAKVVPEMKENDTLQPVEASDNLLDRIHGFTDKPVKSNKQKVKDTAVRKLIYQSTKIDRMEKRKKNFELQKHSYSLSSDKTSNPPQHFGNAAEGAAVRKSSTHVSASGNTGELKQPQVKLRMVPSEKESIVSINVDQASAGLDPLNSTSKQLFVVVQSDQKEDPQLPDNQWNQPTLRRTTKSALQRNNFGPMRISISEDSAPVKQIEFSINGKPVSELKSITARTERLDVVSSADKIEIRIPFAKDDPNALDKAREGDLSRGINSNVGQILNLQISANFQDESTKGNSAEAPAKTMRYQYSNDTIPKSSPSISKSSYLSNNFLETREDIFNNNNMQQFEPFKRTNVKFNDERNVKKHKISDNFEIQRKATKSVLTGKTNTDISLRKQVNNVETGSLNIRKADTTELPNKYNKNESSDNRIPSKIIPWWSSSDSFNKIKKKEDDHRPLMPPTNRSNYKTNLNQNLITETLLSKSKETSNSKILTKKTQSINSSNSNNTIPSNSNSTKPYEESKSTLHYAYSFRLKSNQENLGIAPENIENNLKIEHNQSLITNEDTNQISGIKQTKSNTLFKSDTMNIKDKHDSIKENTPILLRKMKAPNSAQNLSPKKNQEKENNYSLKQTRSIDDVSKNITSKIKDILDAIKPIERKEDGILMDYNSKREMLSRKPTTVILNSEMKEVQNQSPIITKKDLISNSSTAEISKKVDKTMLTKQIESIKEKLKTKMDISLKKNNLKNDTTINLRALNENNVKNIKEICKNNLMNSSSSNFNNFPDLPQTLKKQEQFDDINDSQDKSKQNLKSLLEADKNGSTCLLNTRISSGPVQRLEKKLESLGKVPLEESKQNRPKSLTTIKNISESEKVKGLTSSKLANPFKESPDMIMINKSPSQTVKQIQLKSSKNINKIGNVNKLSSSQTISNSKIKDCARSKNLIDKNISEISVPQSPQTKKINMGDMVARIVTQNPKSKDPLAKNCEENFNKSGTSKGNLFGSADPSKKSNNLVGFKSVGSKTKSTVIANNNCTCDRKLFMESFYSNFNRKNDIMSNSQSDAFIRQNLSDMLEHPVPTAIGCDGSWTNIDRPEKNILYSAWLQRFANIKKNGKLF